MKTLAQFARILDGQEDISSSMRRNLKDNGFAALYVSTTGYTQLAGAIWSETDAMELWFDRDGFRDDCSGIQAFRKGNVISADFPHAKFSLMDEGRIYTQGIVFRVEDAFSH